MAKKRDKAVVWGMVITCVLLCAGFIGYVQRQPPRLVPVLQNVDGKQGNRKHSFSVNYYWLTPDCVLVSRMEDHAYIRFDLRTGKETAMKEYPKSLIGISPDGRYLIGIEPDPPQGNMSLHSHIIAAAVDRTETQTWSKARDLFFMPFVFWTQDGKYWFLEKEIFSSGSAPKQSKLLRVSMRDFNDRLQPIDVQPGDYDWLGTDDRNRLLAWDKDKTPKNGSVEFTQTYRSPTHTIVQLQGAISHIALAAFSLNSTGEPTAPNKPERFLVRAPPVRNPGYAFALSSALSPNGRKIAWMTNIRELLPSWLSWLPSSISYKWQKSKLQLWVSDLSDEALQQDASPRLVYAMNWDWEKHKPLANGQGVPGPSNLCWTPDGKYLTFLDDNTIWRLRLP